MHIRTVTAHAFGPLAYETLQFADRMTVVAGDNESAKSSWHAAIYAALCGRRRGRGRPRADEQRFIDLHEPWDGDDWLVSAEITLGDGRRIELRQDLAGKVDCSATDLDLGTDVSAEVMHDGAPDGARWLRLDRTSFMATACVQQAQMLRVLDGAGGLQQHLQRAAATAGADATAASALALIDDFGREHVGTDRANSTRPLRHAMDAVQAAEEQVERADQAHQEYLGLAERADHLRAEAGRAEAEVRAHEAAAAACEAGRLAERARRAAELQADLGDAPPAPAAADDALAQQVTEALTRWRGRPDEPALSGPTAAHLQAEIDALPPMPEGDLDVHASVTETQDALHRSAERLAQLEADRPQAPAAGLAAGASDQELVDLAYALETTVPGLDPGLEAAAEAARRAHASARPRARLVNVIFAAAGAAVIAAAALLASRQVAAGAVALVIAVMLAAFGVARRGGGTADAQRCLAEAEARLAAARAQAEEAERRRDEAIRRCGQLGLDADPAVIRQAVTERARVASYRDDLARWEARHADLQDLVRRAADELMRALEARGHRVASPDPGGLTAAMGEYRTACARRTAQAARARDRERLTTQLVARRDQERRAGEDWRERERAAALVMEAGAACGIPAEPTERTAASLEKWLAQRAEQMTEADQARRDAAELEALLGDRTLEQLAQQATAAARKAEQLAGRTDPLLLADVDPAAAAGQLPGLHEHARDAGSQAAEAEGKLRQFAVSVPSVAEAEEALQAAGTELDRVRQLQKTLGLTRQFLENAQDRVHRDIAPVLARTLRQWLPAVTAGRYDDVIVDPGTLQVKVCGPSRRWRLAERLSYGTAEQVYLLLRIALADHLTRGHDTCPLILDDVTVHADAVRKNEILALLLQIAEQRQVILFTQEDQVAHWAREHLTTPDHAFRTLTPVPAS